MSQEFGLQYKAMFNRLDQIDIAKTALMELFHHGSVSSQTAEQARSLGISEARLNAMVTFIKKKGPPRN